MDWKTHVWPPAFLGVLLFVAVDPCKLSAAHRHPANVPPTREIAVISPNADPLGRPTPVLQHGPNGEVTVDIPPTVLVHNYYYTGDRSFQAQLLPGGPTIIVVNHPKTGKRCYIEAQMMPGAPRVTYTDDAIEYDYGEHGITVQFGHLFSHKPSVKYRSGLPWHEKLEKAVHAEEIHDKVGSLSTRATRTVGGAVVHARDTLKQLIVTPTTQVLRRLPLGSTVLDTDWENRLSERYLQDKRQREIRALQEERERQQATFRTIR